MQGRKSYRNQGLSVVLHDGVSALPTPTGTPSSGGTGDVREWRVGTYAPRACEIAVDLDDGGTSARLPSPVELIGFDAATERWRSLGILNGGSAIVVDSDIGWAQRVGDVGSYEHLQVRATGGAGGGAITGDAVTITATPIEETT